MLKAYKYRIYPTKEQEKFFTKTFGCVRKVWNLMLAEKMEIWKQTGKIPRITPAKYKKKYPYLKEVDSLALANVQLNLEKAFRNHFSNPKRFNIPQFKKKKDVQKYTTNNNTKYDTVKLTKKSEKYALLKLPKLKAPVKVRYHREFTGRIRSVTITKTQTGKYFASILVDEPCQPLPCSEYACGIDVGIESFATISDNRGNTVKVKNPNYFIKSEKRLRRLQKKLSRRKHPCNKNDKTKKSHNFIKLSARIAKLHEKIRNQRKDFLHKLSKAVVNDNQVITVEDLNVKGMLKNHRLAKHISDAGWKEFLSMFEYKSKWYGRTLIKVDRFYPSSKTCSVCGYVKKDLKLSDREWTCPVCGTRHDRDINASINLCKIGQELSEFTPVEKATAFVEAGSLHFCKWR